MKKVLLLLLVTFLCRCPRVSAQRMSAPIDTSDYSKFHYSQIIAPAALLTAGTIIHFAMPEMDHKFNDWTSTWKGDRKGTKADDYLLFLPEVMHMGLGLAGAKAENPFWDRAIEAVWTYTSVIAVGYTLKAVVDSPRPDLSDNKSFPSGHAAFAFAGAELVRMEYGWGWGAGAYAVATGVSVLRLYNNEHWGSDLLFGAGTGILYAHIGGWLLEPTKRWLGIKKSADIAVAPAVDPVSGTICVAMRVPFPDRRY